MDLGLRARERGIPTVLHPQIGLTHHGRHSIEREPFVQLAQTRHAVIARRLGSKRAALDDAAQFLTFALRAPFKPRARQQLRALKHRDPGSARVAESG
jgi:GT2 family glycosyltransferase